MSIEFPNEDEKPKLTEEDLNNLLHVKLDQGFSLEQLLHLVKRGETIKFIATKSYDIFFTVEIHDIFRRERGINENECLVTNGYFYLENYSKMLKFVYYGPEIPKVVKDKIRQFLESKGVEIKGVEGF